MKHKNKIETKRYINTQFLLKNEICNDYKIKYRVVLTRKNGGVLYLRKDVKTMHSQEYDYNEAKKSFLT
jgi:hypothetical protein